MTVSAQLTGELKRLVLDLEDDLRTRVQNQPDVLAAWQAEHQAAIGRERTAMQWPAWRDDRVTQAAVAWVLTSVFVRFCEDNRLLQPVWITGPAERRQEALDAELEYVRAHPETTAREWLLQAVEHLAKVPATRDLVESHSPLWTVSPSGPAAKRLVDFWRATTDEGELVRDFTDPALSTRFLGDLYQDMSEYAKKTYALLQTPVFVEEFILDQTLEPALAERPLEGFRLIDPACGSGHFLLGAFARLDDRWAKQAPGLDVQARVQKALDAIHGVDLNPFAVAITRFRLLVTAIKACGLTSLEQAPAFTLHLAAGDSLLHGSDQLSMDLDGYDEDSVLSGFAYATEDMAALRQILTAGRYDVVVGNPPYITVKDKRLNDAYRERYLTCKGTYALTVPFMERFFQLANKGTGDQPAGWVGQITSNSFMKREFGSKLIEDFLAKQDMRLVVDTSGAYIPGHGTPTVILVGRPQPPVGPTVKAVLGVRGEPSQPADPAKGLVWLSIVENLAAAEFDGTYISVTDLPRATLATHPWSMGGGGGPEVLRRLHRSTSTVGGIASVGVMGMTNADPVFLAPAHAFRTRGVEPQAHRQVVVGEVVRDYTVEASDHAVFLYNQDQLLDIRDWPGVLRWLWPTRTATWARATFSKITYRQEGRTWWEWHQVTLDRLRTPLSLTFAFVATHNHFVLDRGGKAFKQTAPVIKLPKEATEDDHLSLLGVLNSSTACFWLKQNCQAKAVIDEQWGTRYEYNGSTVADLPLPAELPLAHGRTLDGLARDQAASSPSAIVVGGVPTVEMLARAEKSASSLRGRMIAEQEELDWDVYQRYGLLDEDLTYAGDDLPEMALGERAFEIALARRVAAGEEETVWFSRHGSTPITEIPPHWPQAYRDLVQRRLDLIESDRFIRLLEKPEYKRRWASVPWETQVEKALRGWLLDRLEDRRFWFDAQGRPTPRSVGQLADAVSRDADLVSVLELWSGRKDQSVAQQLAALLADESVPFLAAYRLKDSGMTKREAWEHTWELQRREDAGEQVGTIPVPPKYTSADFRKQAWWAHRGKLDVPKERFILYPDAGRETDPTQLLGWAGWDHAQQALALGTIIGEREAEGWDDERLVPLVAGLAELQPWVTQWHNEIDPTYQVNLAEFCAEHLRERAAKVGCTLEQLRAWRPAAPARGRRAGARARRA